jgi:hypothetical protein
MRPRKAELGLVPAKVGLPERFSGGNDPSVRPAAEMSFRGAVAVPESYRNDEFRNELRAVSISVVNRYFARGLAY